MNSNIISDKMDRKTKNLFPILICTVSVLLILFGIRISILSILAFAVLSAAVIFARLENVFTIMFFLIPFANIFKMDFRGTSLFTYLQLFFVVRFIIRDLRITSRFLIAWIILFILQLLGSRMSLSLLIKQAVIPLLVCGSAVLIGGMETKITISLSIGVVVSGLVASFPNLFPGLQLFLHRVIAYDLGGRFDRFTGLYSDPNYFSVVVLSTTLGILTLVNAKRIDNRWLLLCIPMLYFGVLTISKMFFFMLLVLYLIFIWQCFHTQKYRKAAMSFAVILFLMLGIVVGKIDIFNNFFQRISVVGDLSTGRIRIWKDYLAYFVTHPIHLIIGNGIGSEPLHGPAHNTLIDFLYYYGLIGTILFFRIIVRSVPRHQPITIMNGCVLLGMLFMSMSLSYLEAYDFGLLMSFGICYLLMGNHAGASVSSKIEDHLAQGEAYANQRDYSSI